MANDLDTSQIKNWRSIITLIVFVLTNIVVLFPFHIPIYIPRLLYNVVLDSLSACRVISPRQKERNGSRWVQLNFPMNFVTTPLIADLFLLAILAIGRQEVHDGAVGANNIAPISIMVFFLSLAYIAISIDASGLIRYLSFQVLQRGGKVGHRLFFYLYSFFFILGSFIGNDPIILSGTAFLAYMTRVSSNIVHPRAWIHSQFAVANIASAILVSSNPTNLVLAGAFNIKFIVYTANMIVPVVVTVVVLFPVLLYIIFADESLIPSSIKMHELSEEAKAKKPVNPNIPHTKGNADDEENKLLSLEEIMNPFLDKGGAAFGAVIMAATLITVLVLNAASSKGSDIPVFWITLPAAVVMFCWDIAFGWYRRHETREIARRGRREIEAAREQQVEIALAETGAPLHCLSEIATRRDDEITSGTDTELPLPPAPTLLVPKNDNGLPLEPDSNQSSSRGLDEEKGTSSREVTAPQQQHTHAKPTLVSLIRDANTWAQETFPTVTAVISHMPFPLVPFALCMFVLVQALVTKGWVPVFAYGWNHWVNWTGTVGSIAGMGFLSVILCNFAGTNIGTAILLSRVIQAWQEIHRQNGTPISDRTFWATVYSMALGLNYGAFSTAFSASLAGLLWRDILARKHIRVSGWEFTRVNFPIITVSMIVGCAVLIGEIYIIRGEEPYDS